MKALDNKRFWILGGLVAALLIAAAGWFLLISPELDGASGDRATAQSVRDQNVSLESKVVDLKKQNEELPTYVASLKDALEALPADSGMPAFTRQITAQAAQAHVSVSDITVGGITPYTPPIAPDAAPAADGSSDDTSASTSTTTAAPTATASTGIFEIQVSVMTSGPLHAQETFLNSVQTAGPRRALITGTQLIPAGSNTSSIDTDSTATIQMTLFSAPQTPQQEALLQKLLSGDLGN